MTEIRKYREAAKTTQYELATQLGVSVDTIRRYEAKTSEPRASELKKMARLFNCTVDELIGNEPNPTPPLPEQEQGKLTA
ncbi:MAG: helix-turn-helix transcriptional regulator [Synergistaceae bacterium]|nr:helix-turn-helix transcriptional regulator [Synergistaceae bacterium]